MVSVQDQRDDSFARDAQPDRSRVTRSFAVSLTGLAFVLGTIASIAVPPSDQGLQDLVFGAMLGAVYGVTVLGVRIFDARVVAPGLGLLLALTPCLWFAGLPHHQFAFASATVLVVGLLLSLGLAAASRESPFLIGTLFMACVGITVGWLLFAYLDPRIELLTGVKAMGNDRLPGSSITLVAALTGAALTIWWLTRRTERP